MQNPSATLRPTVTRLAGRIRHAIAEGKHPPHEPMPSYRQLARDHSVSLWTVGAALDVLQEEGLVVRHERRGTFARPPIPARFGARASEALRCINFVMPPHPLPAFLQTAYLEGYTEALDHRNIRMRYVSLEPGEGDCARLLSPNLPLEAQGFILVNCRDATPLRWMKERGIPCAVQFFARYATLDMPEHFGIHVNKTGGAFEATNHLIRFGHRSIGFMAGEGEAPPPSNRVYEGYRAALNCAGLDCPEGDVLHIATEDRALACRAARRRLQRRPGPTAMLAGNDTAAMGALDAARELGLRVPEDLSVVGFNNQPETEQTDPPLTTVSVPRRELAKGAVELLLEAVEEGNGACRTCILDCHLIVRGSAAPPGRSRAT